MKLLPGFMKRTVAGITLLIPIGENRGAFDRMFKLSPVAEFIVDKLIEGDFTREELLNGITEAYVVDAPTAAADLDEFLVQLREAGILAE